MSSKEELVDLFKTQIKIEQTIVDSVKEGLVEIQNAAVIQRVIISNLPDVPGMSESENEGDVIACEFT